MSEETRSQIGPDNPLGVTAIDHLEFTTDDMEGATRGLFRDLGFQKTYESEKGDQALLSQGQIRFLLNSSEDAKTHARRYWEKHGEGVCKMAFLVEDANYALEEASRRGAEVVHDLETVENEKGVFKRGAIRGFGDVLNEFVERPKEIFSPTMKKIDNDPVANPLKQRVARIDHLTNNVPRGEMEKWAEFYERVYGMSETRYFDIKGMKTGLESKVMQLKNGSVIIPINEPDSDNSKSQIQEFLDRHKGAGVQHIALTTADMITTISELRERGMEFLEVPSTYYDGLKGRGLNPTENRADLEKNHILVDGDEDGYLLQIFTQSYVGPLFFEYIQRKGHNGFGEGNFEALFDAIEKDQIKRGYL